MIISVASGKGGTGKTTIATNLAVALKMPVQLLECDVEEPNAISFSSPPFSRAWNFIMEVPEIDAAGCTFCGKCQEICQFNAIAVLPNAALTFPELCHSYGGCFLVCPEQAVISKQRRIGTVESGARGPVSFTHGRLRVGEALGGSGATGSARSGGKPRPGMDYHRRSPGHRLPGNRLPG